MNTNISLFDYVRCLEKFIDKYPNATITGVGNGLEDGKWYYFIYVKENGKEAYLKIPAYN